ncbi:MAG: endonuclease domain-containing protein [Deltaproteobacteria bacterium]|nr:endonuclease domain-containing protein [Deltaproteobacteria bacterium]
MRGPGGSSEAMRALVRHQWVREHGTPRLSVLVGEARAARALWSEWITLTGRDARPIVLVPASATRDAIAAVVQAAIGAAARAPRLPSALALRPTALARFARDRDDRWAAVIDEGRIDLAASRASAARATAARAPRPATTARARSLAELTLFEALEATAATAGRFALNQRVPVRFGPGDLEIDLVDLRARVAIEVDGFHHFGDPDRYRTDRKKDLLLQSQGFLVVRVLAEDVHADPRAAVNAVCEALAHVQRREAREARAKETR